MSFISWRGEIKVRDRVRVKVRVVGLDVDQSHG